MTRLSASGLVPPFNLSGRIYTDLDESTRLKYEYIRRRNIQKRLDKLNIYGLGWKESGRRMREPKKMKGEKKNDKGGMTRLAVAIMMLFGIQRARRLPLIVTRKKNMVQWHRAILMADDRKKKPILQRNDNAQ